MFPLELTVDVTTPVDLDAEFRVCRTSGVDMSEVSCTTETADTQAYEMVCRMFVYVCILSQAICCESRDSSHSNHSWYVTELNWKHCQQITCTHISRYYHLHCAVVQVQLSTSRSRHDS